MEAEKLFWSLFKAQGDERVTEALGKFSLIDSDENWFPYGARDRSEKGNSGIFEIQMSNPVPALVEKITNSIDAILLKECKLRGIDPKSSSAPENMAMAVERFFGIKNGDFSEVSWKDRRNIAVDIQIIAEGDKKTPDVIVYDNGEGKSPDDFPGTFLSIGKRNKTDIRFVQGRYNFGSTGAVIFCGKNKYQLICSKLCDELNKGQDKRIGYTLVRRHPLTEEEEKYYEESWYEYLILDGSIPRFSAESIDLGLYGRKFRTGSLIKLYSYGLPRGSRSYVTLDLWRDLNQYLYHPALPFIVYEKRWKEQKTPTKPVLGNKTRLTLDERDSKEQTITSSILDSKFGEIPIEVHVLRNHIDQKEFINNKAIVFTINGQFHGGLPRRFISKDIGFTLLRDHMLVHVDCTYVKKKFRREIFKASRDRLNEGPETEYLLDKLIETLKNNDVLRNLNQDRKNRILRESKGDKDLLSIVMSKIPVDKELMKLLKSDEDFNLFKNRKNKNETSNNSVKNSEEKNKYISRRFPSIFKVDLPENKEGRLMKSIPLNGKGIIHFETDVEDEYLFRPKEKGEFELLILDYNTNEAKEGNNAIPSKVEEVFNVTKAGPTNNSIKVTFSPKESLNVGDEIKVNARLTSPEGDLNVIFWIRIKDPSKQSDKKKKKSKDFVAPPKPIRVYEEADNEDVKVWGEFGWGGWDIVKIITDLADNGSLVVIGIAVNMDSFALKRFMSRNKIEQKEKIRLVKEKYFWSVYLHSLFLYSILDRINKSTDLEANIEPDDIIPLIFKPYSKFLLFESMIEGI